MFDIMFLSMVRALKFCKSMDIFEILHLVCDSSFDETEYYIHTKSKDYKHLL